jgi:hypothetical protein
MSVSLVDQDVNSSYQSSLCELTQAIEWGQGQFSLILAHCNSPKIRKRALDDLEHCEAFPLYTVSLQSDAELMFSSISLELARCDGNIHDSQHFSFQHSGSGAIAISGFEGVSHIDTLLSSADTVRDELRKVFHCPLIWWMSDAILVKLIRLAPNIHSWFTFVEFLSAPNELDCLEPVRPEGELKRLGDLPVMASMSSDDRDREMPSPIVWSPTFVQACPSPQPQEAIGA